MKPTPLVLSYRSLTALVVFIGTCVLYLLRVNLSVAIVCMVAPRNASVPSNSSRISGDKFNWDRSVQGQLLGSFFIGYMVLQIPAGVLSQKFGPRKVIGFLFSIATISTLLLPSAARVSWRLVLALRVLTGFGSGVMFPSLHQLWSRWAPPLERSKLVGFSYAGAQVGTVIGLSLSSLLCDTIGWEYVFYLYGAAGVLWTALWFACVYDAPSLHPRMTEAERDYINTSLAGQVKDSAKNSAKLPLLKVLSSLPFWALVVTNITYDYGGYTFITNLPTYMRDVFGFSLVANGFVSCLPYIGFYILQLLSACIADSLQVRGVLSTLNTRKLMTCISMLPAAAIAVVLGFIDSSQRSLAVALLITGISFNGAGFSGMLINHVDIAPRFAGVLFAITNTVAAVTGLAAPLVVSSIVHSGTQAEWRIVLLITGISYCVGCVFYLIFARASVQPWAMPKQQQQLEKQMQCKENGIRQDTDSIHEMASLKVNEDDKLPDAPE